MFASCQAQNKFNERNIIRYIPCRGAGDSGLLPRRGLLERSFEGRRPLPRRALRTPSERRDGASGPQRQAIPDAPVSQPRLSPLPRASVLRYTEVLAPHLLRRWVHAYCSVHPSFEGASRRCFSFFSVGGVDVRLFFALSSLCTPNPTRRASSSLLSPGSPSMSPSCSS